MLKKVYSMKKINVLVIGNGGREHAISRALNQSRSVELIYANPGNPGILEFATFAEFDLSNHNTIIEFCKTNSTDLVVIGPEQPLSEGIVDSLKSNGILCFGPDKYAAQLESSKSFAKDFMNKFNIPTAKYKHFNASTSTEAHDYINTLKVPLVLKADGLAGGKGVVIPESYIDAHSLLDEMFSGKFGDASDTVVIEEFLEGEEASVFAICDGNDFITLAPAQDHKRAYDNDKGPNTGGMGAYAPAPIVTDEVIKYVEDNIIKPVLKGMKEEGHPFVGCLFCGLMIKDQKANVVEFNVRFGDPETQCVLSIFEGDLGRLFYSAAEGNIDKTSVINIAKTNSCNVVLASKGYPTSFEKGFEISGLENATMNGTIVYHAGTKMRAGKIITNGGRVLGVTSFGDTLEEAINNSYESVNKICFDNIFYRKDIGKKALK